MFLDRDGTIIRDAEYCGDPKEVEVFAGAAEALLRLKTAGFKVVIITNQSGIGRGFFTEAHYRSVEREVERQLGADLIEATYFCPDTPDSGSTRRKPETGMVFEAEHEHQLDLTRSFFIGDKVADAECGRRAGLRTIIVTTGIEQHGESLAADWTVKNLAAAADIILAHAV